MLKDYIEYLEDSGEILPLVIPALTIPFIIWIILFIKVIIF